MLMIVIFAVIVLLVYRGTVDPGVAEASRPLTVTRLLLRIVAVGALVYVVLWQLNVVPAPDEFLPGSLNDFHM